METTNKNNSRFDDWTEVDCNECARYWDSSCDGVSKGQNRLCTSFLATRSVVIPEQIKRLQKVVKWLLWAVAFLAISVACHHLGILIGW